MYVRTVTFGLDGITREQYAEHCEAIASVFNGWPGLIAKVWLDDPDAGVHGGVYLFEDREAADRSRATPEFAGMLANPAFADVTVTEYATLERPTAVTGGPLVAERSA
jgi:Putative mono-oxygenase ydhR